jgi:hypothetical protein
MDARSEPGLNDPFEEAFNDALRSLPADLRAAMSNVEIVVEDEPPDGQRLLGLYRGVPLPRRSSTYSGVLPDKISIFRGPQIGGKFRPLGACWLIGKDHHPACDQAPRRCDRADYPVPDLPGAES